MPVSKTDAPGQKPTQVYHINLDQPPISQSGGGGGGVSSVQSQKPQITMEKISDRYHVEVKHEGPPPHGGPPPHQLPEGVVYTPLMPNMPLHPNVMQISGGPQQVTIFCVFKFLVHFLFLIFYRILSQVLALHRVMLQAATLQVMIHNNNNIRANNK